MTISTCSGFNDILLLLKTNDMLDETTTAALAVCCVHLRVELKFEHSHRQRQKRKELVAANRRLRAQVVQLGLRLQESRENAEAHVRTLMAIHQMAEEAHMCVLPNPQH